MKSQMIYTGFQMINIHYFFLLQYLLISLSIYKSPQGQAHRVPVPTIQLQGLKILAKTTTKYNKQV